MPTGYTAGIIDGEINTFNEFAIGCIRAFGATIHMRDEPNNKPYEPRVPSSYHKNRIIALKKERELINNTSDEELIFQAKNAIYGDITKYKKHIEETKQKKTKLDNILDKAYKFNPPTEEHVGFKDFMIQQLKDTIKQDGDTLYYEDALNTAELSLKSIFDAKQIRKDKLTSIAENLEYCKTAYNKEVTGCHDSNKWVDDLFQALERYL
jgi:vacuolar-type H+-ATPase subunit I/STV1